MRIKRSLEPAIKLITCPLSTTKSGKIQPGISCWVYVSGNSLQNPSIPSQNNVTSSSKTSTGANGKLHCELRKEKEKRKGIRIKDFT
jgi:hypothetical protein